MGQEEVDDILDHLREKVDHTALDLAAKAMDIVNAGEDAVDNVGRASLCSNDSLASLPPMRRTSTSCSKNSVRSGGTSTLQPGNENEPSSMASFISARSRTSGPRSSGGANTRHSAVL